MIPLLKPSTDHYTELCDKVSMESFNFLEHLMQRYPNALLDIFPSALDEESEALKRYILLEHYKVWDSLKGAQSYGIEDVTLLSVFVKAVLRECLTCTLYFQEQPMLLISNYDLSLPLCFLDGKDRLIYKAMAEKNGLFFR